MIGIYPTIENDNIACPKCGGSWRHETIHWQGAHTATESNCQKCSQTFLIDFPVNQSNSLYRILNKETGQCYDENGTDVTDATPWFNEKLSTITTPIPNDIQLTVEQRTIYKEVIILNTIDYVYGHSLLFLFNLQRLIRQFEGTETGVVVLVQPMMKWLIPTDGIAEVWTASLTFDKAKGYYPSLSKKINTELTRFNRCYLSRGYILPTNKKIDIESFVKLGAYNFDTKPVTPRITFIWREDPGRLWVRSIYLLKAMQKSGFDKILLPLHLLRLKLFFYLLRRKLPNESYQLSVAGLGKYGKFASYVDDQRVSGFSTEEEISTCQVYGESELVIGVHGSSMLLPSAMAGMSVSMMPSKRWGNFAEDILYTSDDPRLASFQQRIIPLNLSIFDTIDICVDMLKGRPYFVRKFIYSEDY